MAFWSSLVQYLNNVGDGADGKHNAISSFFMWAWDANADTQFGLGGMIKMDYETLNWPKMAMLIDNSTEFSYGLGLRPWYLSGFILPAGNHKYASRVYGLKFEHRSTWWWYLPDFILSAGKHQLFVDVYDLMSEHPVWLWNFQFFEFANSH